MTEKDNKDCAALIVAAGKGIRAANSKNSSSNLPKQYWELGPKPVIRYSVDYFVFHPRVKITIVVISPNMKKHFSDLTKDISEKLFVVDGGLNRQDSVRAGLNFLARLQDLSSLNYVAIHDAARPLVPLDMLDRLLKRLSDSDINEDGSFDTKSISNNHVGVVPVVPVPDSLKRLEQNEELSEYSKFDQINRTEIVGVQTPQVFNREIITKLHNRSTATFSDDSSMVEAAGYKVATIHGARSLLKLTDKFDFSILNHTINIQNLKDGNQNSKMREVRTGTGYDVHALQNEPGEIWIAGCKLKSPHKVVAHSDGDVAIHALCDAIFGALADGDIGEHFSPSDSKWKDANSSTFLDFAMKRVYRRSGILINADITVICEEPKIAPHRDKMKRRIAEICGVSASCVNIKATTSEGIGFIGRREGIAAHASVTICLPRDQV